MNLVKVIKQIKSDIRQLEIEKNKELEKISIKYDVKIKDLIIALQVNKELNTVCLECDGRGRVSFTDGAGDTDYDVCKVCKGKGVCDI